MRLMSLRQRKGSRAHALGLRAEEAACTALAREGWSLLARRMRTEAGELDILAEKDGVLAIIEVKARPTLAGAAAALSPRQQARLLAAAEVVLAAHPEWGGRGVRFDLLVVDRAGAVRRISDAFRVEA
jgi:putative endonuclease